MGVIDPPVAWLIAALLLGIAELAVPGVFLVFLAIAAAVTGVAVFALPALPVAAQLGSFAVWSVVTVLIGKRWYRDYPVAGDPLLNDRAARLVGQPAVVVVPIEGGVGRVRIGDGDWPASGPDAPAGTAMRIVAVRDGVAEVAVP
ncbi:NfeD family protein [Sphingomonas sp. PB2P19]|uniref:NfeD family protein n=1 Tax=Sphingomonas rhamnosi TaxID=3096156 RepID=UPI002FC755E4